MKRTLSRTHLLLAAGLALVAGGLGAGGNALGGAYALIAAVVVLSRALERTEAPVPVRVEVEP